MMAMINPATAIVLVFIKAGRRHSRRPAASCEITRQSYLIIPFSL
jgi:hypothetical protein